MDDLEVATRAAESAATVIRRARSMGQVRMKGAVDPVTQVDLEAEQAIFRVIEDERPGDRVLAEESGGTLEGRTWVVDPLDGTVNFVQGVEHYAVSVALWDGDEPLVGVVVDVSRGRTYRAERGAGAECDGTRIAVATDSLGDALVATGFPYDRRERAAEYGRLVGRLLATARGVRRFGAAALDFAWVSDGRLGGYVEHGLAPWDVAAGILLVTEAGGVVLDERGSPAGLRSRSFVAGSEPVAARLVPLLDAG